MRIVPPRPVAPLADPTAIAHQLIDLQAHALPGEVLQAAKASILDTLAVAWAGQSAAGMAALRQTVLEDGGAPQSRLWGSGGERVPAAAAALHNGSLAAALDFDSLHVLTSHADAVVIPAALAMAEQVGASGRSLLAACVAGTELVYRLGRATTTSAGWFRTSVYGVFGATAAAGRLLGLDHAQMASALGLALGQAAGTQQHHVERTLSKRLQSAFAARAGVEAARLAQRGLSGPAQPFDGRYGLFALYDAGDPSTAFDDFGTHFLSLQTSFKKYPSCGCSHAAIEAALHLAHTHALDPAEIDSVDVVITPYMDRLVSAPYTTEGDPEVTGQFCAQYEVAAALARRRFAVQDIEPAAVLDPSLHPLIARVRITVDTASEGTMAPATVHVNTRQGQRLSHTTAALPGGTAQPLTREQRHAKALAAFTHGSEGLPEASARTLIGRIEQLDTLDDVRTLLDLTP